MAMMNAPIGQTINATVAAQMGWNIPSTKMFIMTFHVMAVNGLAPKINCAYFSIARKISYTISNKSCNLNN